MINPHTKTGEDLAHVAEHLAAWPMNTDFVHVQSGVIHMIEGGSSSVVSYISREQWAAAKSLHQYWFPEKQPKPEGFCDVCGDTHCIHELYPGICAEYDGGMVSLDLAKAIYNGDFRHENAEDSMNKTSDLVHRSIICPEHGLQDGLTFCPDCLADQASAKEDELSRRAQIDICNQVGAFSTPEEDEAWREAEKKINPVWKSPHPFGGVCVFHGVRYAAYEPCPMCVLANASAKEKVNLCPSCGGLSISTHGKQREKDEWIDEVLTPEIEKIRDCINRLMEVEAGR